MWMNIKSEEVNRPSSWGLVMKAPWGNPTCSSWESLAAKLRLDVTMNGKDRRWRMRGRMEGRRGRLSPHCSAGRGCWLDCSGQNHWTTDGEGTNGRRGENRTKMKEQTTTNDWTYEHWKNKTSQQKWGWTIQTKRTYFEKQDKGQELVTNTELKEPNRKKWWGADGVVTLLWLKTTAMFLVRCVSTDEMHGRRVFTSSGVDWSTTAAKEEGELHSPWSCPVSDISEELEVGQG